MTKIICSIYKNVIWSPFWTTIGKFVETQIACDFKITHEKTSFYDIPDEDAVLMPCSKYPSGYDIISGREFKENLHEYGKLASFM